MLNQYFYHEHTRRAVSVFGTLFNDIQVIKRDGTGNALRRIKVPLSYGPRQKFLARIRQEENLSDPRLAIKLPRMAFEITSIEYDESTRLTRGTKYTLPGDSIGSRKTMYYPSTYRLGFELNIISKHQDDALQILEQILPYFQPEYTVTVNEVDNNFKSDMPFVLNSVNLSDDYEGDFETRRSLIYTLTFETRIKYYGPLSDDSSVIRETLVNVSDTDTTSEELPYFQQRLQISPADAGEDEEYTIVATYDPMLYESVTLGYESISGEFEIGESVSGNSTGAVGKVSSVNSEDNQITVSAPDDRFEKGETLVGLSSSASFIIDTITPIWSSLNDE